MIPSRETLHPSGLATFIFCVDGKNELLDGLVYKAIV